MVLFRFGVAGQNQGSAVGGREMHVDHLQGGEFFQYGPWGESWGEGFQPVLEGDLEAVSKEGHENVGLDTFIPLVVDRSNGQVALV